MELKFNTYWSIIKLVQVLVIANNTIIVLGLQGD